MGKLNGRFFGFCSNCECLKWPEGADVMRSEFTGFIFLFLKMVFFSIDNLC